MDTANMAKKSYGLYINGDFAPQSGTVYQEGMPKINTFLTADDLLRLATANSRLSLEVKQLHIVGVPT